MIEFPPHSGPFQTASRGNRFATKFRLCTIFGLLLIFGVVGLAAPKKQVKPTAKAGAHTKGTGKKSAAKAPAHSTTSHSKSAAHASSRKTATAHGRYPSAPYKPKYTVARPAQDFHAPVQRAPEVVVPSQPAVDPGAQIPETAVPEPGVPVTSTPAPYVETEAAAAMLAEPTAAPFRYPHALDSFFQALAAKQQASSGTGQTPASSIVRILQFGDSHTAADIFTGEMRAQLQMRFGNGGLGFQYPGHPFAGYRLLGSSRSQTPGWVTQGNRFTQLGDGDTGLGGIAISTSRPGESIFLSTTCETLQVQYLRQPGGGMLDFSDNGQPVSQINTDTERGGAVEASAGTSGTRTAATFTYSCTPGVHEFQLITVESAPVRLLGLVTEQAGVTYECLGINGAVAPLILRWNQQMFADYLGQRNPNLIVLAYGTNEAGAGESHNDEYVAQFHQLLQTLHRVVPNASILVLGPYDRALKTGRGRHASWRTATAIDRIIADQREACRVDNCAFYDQRARMGGPGAMMHWAANGFAQPDHTHLTGTGYRVLANALYRDLMSAYNSYLQTAASLPKSSQPAS